MLGMFGTLLFLGVLIGTVCLFATVLIIYYKQISEGSVTVWNSSGF